FPAAGSAAAAGGHPGWAMAPEAFAGEVGIPGLAHVLEVNSMVRDHPDGPRLAATWSWPGGLLAADEVAELARLWFAALEGVVIHAGRPGAGGHSPSDFSLVNLTQAEIEELEALRLSRTSPRRDWPTSGRSPRCRRAWPATPATGAP